jgi:hypothetical protein
MITSRDEGVGGSRPVDRFDIMMTDAYTLMRESNNACN